MPKVYQVHYNHLDDWKYMKRPIRYKYFFSLDAVNTWGEIYCGGRNATCVFNGYKVVEVTKEQLDKLRRSD
jgi:hypothetical protein